MDNIFTSHFIHRTIRIKGYKFIGVVRWGLMEIQFQRRQLQNK